MRGLLIMGLTVLASPTNNNNYIYNGFLLSGVNLMNKLLHALLSAAKSGNMD